MFRKLWSVDTGNSMAGEVAAYQTGVMFAMKSAVYAGRRASHLTSAIAAATQQFERAFRPATSAYSAIYIDGHVKMLVADEQGGKP